MLLHFQPKLAFLPFVHSFYDGTRYFSLACGTFKKSLKGTTFLHESLPLFTAMFIWRSQQNCQKVFEPRHAKNDRVSVVRLAASARGGVCDRVCVCV